VRAAVKAVATPSGPRAMWIDVARLAALALVAVLLQTTLAPNIRILGANPDFALIVVVAVALLRGAEAGAVFGFVVGFLVSIILFEPAGIGAFTLVVIGFLAGRYAETAELSPSIAPIFTVLLASLLGETMYGLFEFLLGREAPLYFLTTRVLIPLVILNTLLAAPVYLVARWWMRGERHARAAENR